MKNSLGDAFRAAENQPKLSKKKTKGKRQQFSYTVILKDETQTVKEIDSKFDMEIGSEFLEVESGLMAKIVRKDVIE